MDASAAYVYATVASSAALKQRFRRVASCVSLSLFNSIRKTFMPFKPKFHLARLNSTRLDTTRHVRRVELMHFGCVELVEQYSSTRSTRRARLARLARLARHDELDWLDWLD